jgi:hypothetical protein
LLTGFFAAQAGSEGFECFDCGLNQKVLDVNPKLSAFNPEIQAMNPRVFALYPQVDTRRQFPTRAHILYRTQKKRTK